MRFKIIIFFGILALQLFDISLRAAHDQDKEKHVKVALRMIGHQLLLNSGDSSSRVLPVVESDGRYIIQFESDFSFEPSELVSSVNEIVEQTDLADSYIVEVADCQEKSIVYSYEVGEKGTEDIVPCKGRRQPQSCYMIFFTAAVTTPVQTSWYRDALIRAGNLDWLAYLAIAVLIIAIIYTVWRFSSRKSVRSVNPNLIPLGSLHFDKINNLLIGEGEQQILTGKEADLLLLLHSKANHTVQREVIFNRVWGDDGDYVGRTLDVFISKLRKKLDLDSNVKIVNIRGIGYKLVLKH